MADIVDADWYLHRHPDIAGAGIDPLQHFVRFGATEKRDPNAFFDSTWYAEHYSDVAASHMTPLLHYLQIGAAQLRNPHPKFDAAYYVDQHPDAAANPLLYHLRLGRARGYDTERPIRIQDYLPSQSTAFAPPDSVTVDVVIPVHAGEAETRTCITSVLADAGRLGGRTTSKREPNVGDCLGRIIVVEDCSPEPALVAWLLTLAASGRIQLLRNRRSLGFAAAANQGMEAAGDHDVVLLNSSTAVPPGWLRRLTAQAYADPGIATVSPFCDHPAVCGYPDDRGGPRAFGQRVEQLDDICRGVNSGRSISQPANSGGCLYIRREALRQTGPLDAAHFPAGHGADIDFCLRAAKLGWHHRLACDGFVYHKASADFGNRAAMLPAQTQAADLIAQRYPDYPRHMAEHARRDQIAPVRFAVTAGLFRQSGRPVILMISHNLGGGIRRHIDSLVQRYRDTAHVLLLAGTTRGAELSVPALPDHPMLALPADRTDDLVRLLQSMNLSRVHLHHLVRMDMDIRSLIHRLELPFDVTVHDYYAICPQINLLPSPESLYCGEPPPAGCNACIANTSTAHEARDILSWRAARIWQFTEADRVICPSEDVKARLNRYGLAEHAIVVPHERSTTTEWPLCLPNAPNPTLRIVLLGVLANHKGARAVAALAEAAAPGTIEIHLIGYVEASFPKPALKYVQATGPYQDAEIADLLRQTDPHVVWFPSSAPETYSYTLSTAIAAGLPIVATNLGSFTERLAARPFTWLVDHRASTADWIEVFDTVRASLQRRRQKPRALPRLIEADFYADHYLVAEAPTKPTATRRIGADRKPVIAIVPERFENGDMSPCAYIRLLQPLDHPAIGATFDLKIVDARTALDYAADIIVTQRHAVPDIAAADALAAHARRTGATLLYDLDDDLLAIPRTHPDAAQLRPRSKIVQRMLAHADRVWLSTPGLAQRLARSRPDAVVVENRLDERLWTQTPVQAPFQDDPIRILCMGTGTHDQDFTLIQPALVRLKQEYGDRVVIDIIGMTGQTSLPPELNRIGPPHHASRSYPGFVHWLNTVRPEWHIGLAPLLDTPFNRCKSPVKAMDYAAMGLFVLASDTAAYRGCIADGLVGQLVPNNPNAWYVTLGWLLRDQDRRRAVASRARAAFLTRASLASQAEARRNAWLALLPDRSTSAAARRPAQASCRQTSPHEAVGARDQQATENTKPTARYRQKSSLEKT